MSLTPSQARELGLYLDGEPHRFAARPNTNLIRRNILTLAPGAGQGHYRITEYGRALLRLVDKEASMSDFRITIDVLNVAKGDVRDLVEQIVESHGEDFDADRGEFTVSVSKKQLGTFFAIDLDEEDEED